MKRLQTEDHVVGLKQSKKAIEAGKAKLAYISEDADSYIKIPLEELCRKNEVQIVYVDTMKELSKACKVDVPTAVAVIL